MSIQGVKNRQASEMNNFLMVSKGIAWKLGLETAALYANLRSKESYFYEHDMLQGDCSFYHTAFDINLETGLSKYQQTKAINKLVGEKLISVTKKGIPAKRYFLLLDDEDTIIRKLTDEYVEVKKLRIKEHKEEREREKREYLMQNVDMIRSEKTTSLEVEFLPQSNIKETNIKNKRYTITSNGGYVFSYYNFKYKEQNNKDHPTVTLNQLNSMENIIDIFQEYNVGPDDWANAIDEHFEMVENNPANNGNVLGFITGDDMTGPLVRYLNIK